MCQDSPVFPGYDYDRHTRPVTEMLHSIVAQATEGCILLNPSLSTNPDPLGIRYIFEQLYHKMLRVHSKIGEHLVHIADEDYFSVFTYWKWRIDETQTAWLPVDEYFGRLWCYVERIGMRTDAIYCYPGPKDLSWSAC